MPFWSPRSPNRPPVSNGPRVDLSIVEVTSVDEDAYFVHAAISDPIMGAAGGYAFSVFGLTDGTYHRGGTLIQAAGYRVHLKVDSDPDRHGFPDGTIGGGILHQAYAEVWISLHHDYVRDVLFELRRDPRRELRVAGASTGDATFRVDMFMLTPAGR